MSADSTTPGGTERSKAFPRAGGANAVASAVTALRVGTVGSDRFNRYFIIVVSAFGFLYALQSIPHFRADAASLGGSLALLAVLPIWVSALIGSVAAIFHRYSRPILWTSVATYAFGIAVLPFAVSRPIPADPMPWFVNISAVPLLYLAVASRSTLLSVGIGSVLAVDAGVVLGTVGRLHPANAIVNALFMMMLAVVFTLIVTTLRSGIRRADRLQATLLAEYAASQAEGATEAERRRTDALLHDAVLTTFLTAASAQTPEAEDLAGRMAANAIRVLAHVNRSAEYGVAVPFAEAWADALQRLAPLISRFSIEDHDSGTVVLPTEIADAMLAAMAEAMTNSVQYASAEHREVRLAPLGPDGLRIVVHDDGVGFDLASVTLRGMADVVQQPLRRYDGRADIDTAPGHGCTVVLSWGSIVMSGTDPLQDEKLANA